MNDALHSIPPTEIRQLEALGADAWPASEVQHGDGWRLGLSGGGSRTPSTRSNGVMPATA